MSEERIRQAVFESLLQVAPEVEPDELEDDEPLRDQIDIDSMDFLNFVIGIHERLGVEVPERDYPQLDSLAHIIAYVQRAQG
jgi:acyl carrier protein